MEKLVLAQNVLLRRDQDMVLYNTSDMRLFVLENDCDRTPLAEIANLLPNLAQNHEANKNDTTDAFHLARRQAIMPIMFGTEPLTHANIQTNIGRLTLNISNACNLWCSYCYADHGYYHAEKSLMSSQSVQDILSRLMSMYSDISIVHFFGGEPLLNIPAINTAGSFFSAAVENNTWDRMPSFVATTNGTLSSKKIISALKKWDIELTVSWDGPKEVQDTGRPMVGKKSSHDSVVRSLEKFSENDIPYSIECTFNASHRKAGISIVNLMDFFWQQTGERVVHIAPASTPSPKRSSKNDEGIFRITSDAEVGEFQSLEYLIPLYRDATRYTVHNFLRQEGPMLEFAHRVIEQIAQQRRSLNYCPAFFDQLSIAADGSVFPCFMFIGDPKFNLGNILSDTFPTQNGRAVFKKYFDEFGLDPLGTEDWCKSLFGGCVAGDFISTGSMATRYLKPLYEAIIEECIFALALGEVHAANSAHVAESQFSKM